MFRTIVVPLDGSRFAEAALPAATHLARRGRGRVHLIMAHQPAGAPVRVGEMAISFNELDSELKRREQSYVEDAAVRACEVGWGPIEFRLREGPAGPTVCDEVGRMEADLVVMATHGRGAIGRFWFGSVAEYVVGHVSLPVLLVHPDHGEQLAGAEGASGILVALDLSEHSEAVLEPVTAMARLLQSPVTLLHVLEPFYPPESSAPDPVAQDPTITDVRRADAQKHLDRIADRLRERCLSVSTRVMIGDPAGATVLATLQDHSFGMVAMTTHGAGGLRHRLPGSVADRVIRAAEKPVLVVRPEGVLA
jgi:nucleotide-binding universal stress UspA family protein